ncbi:MAG: hypothetical protein DRG24_02900 [Epsilonproteobacteria bacterium]|nr:MAG: hypothetical protein DRG24_02900 [Campylobacterota bacterium]
MLENSIWTQFHTEKTIRETLAEVLSIDAVQISSDETELYAMIKRHLTKKELRLFIMSEAGIDDAAIQAKIGIEADAYAKAKRKVYSKLKSKKISDELKSLAL